jgi:hypothetical protein
MIHDRDRTDMYVEACTQVPNDTVMRIYTSRSNAKAIAATAAKCIREIHSASASRTQTLPLSGAPSTQLILGPGCECLNVLLPGL